MVREWPLDATSLHSIQVGHSWVCEQAMTSKMAQVAYPRHANLTMAVQADAWIKKVEDVMDLHAMCSCGGDCPVTLRQPKVSRNHVHVEGGGHGAWQEWECMPYSPGRVENRHDMWIMPGPRPFKSKPLTKPWVPRHGHRVRVRYAPWLPVQ